MKDIPTVELLRGFGATLSELRRRGICRSENIPTGDLAEYLVCKALKLQQTPNSEKGFDAIDAAGMRYQIKGRRITSWNSSTQLSAVRELDSSPFDWLVAVLFDEEFQVTAAYQISHSACLEVARYVERTNSFTILVNPPFIKHTDTVDLTEAVIEAYKEQGSSQRKTIVQPKLEPDCLTVSQSAEFREFLEARGIRSASRYLLFLNQVADKSGVKISPLTLSSESDVDHLTQLIVMTGLAPKSVANYRSVMRQYVQFVTGGATKK